MIYKKDGAPKNWKWATVADVVSDVLYSSCIQPIEDDKIVCPACGSALVTDLCTVIQHGFAVDVLYNVHRCGSCSVTFCWRDECDLF